ncbi:hypothetical protein [Actinomadura rayongensis]|uniref:Minor tail protein n=1 Tax=Actinomadura rayongensis TaxID=1429076 RepID=A0A6I4WM35_9ACTN|nr:hypothetical protein [Actinomadura rayongensis]MXQ67692.1 hypothetical protein [Actinomadura rayongensis]
MTRRARRALAQRLTATPAPAAFTTGTVTALDTAKHTVTVAPYSGAPASEYLTVPHLGHYAPAPGDTVVMAWIGNALVCIGSYRAPTNLTVTGNLTVNGGITLPTGSHITRGGIGRPSLQNGWSNYGNGYESAGYIELPDNRAALIGVIAAGTATHGTLLFTLPTGVRPATTHVFDAPANSSNKAQIAIGSNGQTILQNPVGAVSWISLSGASWPIAGF